MVTFTKLRTKGFSLVELLVAIAIILILLSIVSASIVEARKDSRDKRRVTDIANLAHALTLYKEKHREYPKYPLGVVFGEDDTLDSEIRLLNGNEYQDPMHVEDAGYAYVYHSALSCNATAVQALVVTKMEKQGNKNFDDVCGHSEQFADSYVYVLK
jgi:prepilin-type N-terminal cleavage/methylation domain-containing protein